MMSVTIGYANSAADRWAAWLIVASLDAALLLAVIGLLWFAIRGRVAPQVGYGLFLLVPLKLLVPVIVTVPAAMAPWTTSGLMSFWFPTTHVSDRTASQLPVEPGMAPVGAEPSALSAPRFEPRSRALPVAADSQQGTSPTEPRSSRPIESSPADSARMVTQAPHLSISAMIMIGWLAAVVLLLGRLAGSQRRFCAGLRHGHPLDESGLDIDLRELCRRAGVP